MSEDINAAPSRGQLRQEAADWFAVMRGPDADMCREEFSTWLAMSPDHRRAYNSVTETFNITKGLTRKADARLSASGFSAATYQRLGLILAAIAVVVSMPIGWIAWKKHRDSAEAPSASQVARGDREARFATSIGEIRNFVLIDGSRLTLDTNSIVLASYTSGERGLRLVKGRARFYVSPEARPFVVRADTTVVTARGTIFDVTMVHERDVQVHLLKGAVDVQSQPFLPPSASANALTPITTHLISGQQLGVEADRLVMSRLAAQGDESWPDGVEAFNDVPLSDLVAATNRYAHRPVLIDSPRIGSTRISGTFHLGDTGAVAHQVADLLSLSVTEDSKSFHLGPH